MTAEPRHCFFHCCSCFLFFPLNKYAEFTGDLPVGQLMRTLAAEESVFLVHLSPQLSVFLNEHTLWWMIAFIRSH